jgi:HNH endonuclease
LGAAGSGEVVAVEALPEQGLDDGLAADVELSGDDVQLVEHELRIPVRMKCLDHVIPRVQFGRNSYRNLVSCCMECNSSKKERSAADYLRWLYRQGRVTAIELNKGLRALNDLAAGKLRPVLQDEKGDRRTGEAN